jgi:hypothetical protein
MATRDIFEDLGDLLVGNPARTDYSGVPGEVRSDVQDEDARRREELVESLRLSWEEGDQDPLLAALQGARARMMAAEREMRLLIAYGREFVQPRPYRLGDLAEAAGMSVSGVRTAYGNEEIIKIAQATGAKLRPAKEDA